MCLSLLAFERPLAPHVGAGISGLAVKGKRKSDVVGSVNGLYKDVSWKKEK